MNTKDWLDKIEWDDSVNKSLCKFTYINFGKEIEVPYDAIITRDSFSFTLNQNGNLAEVPLHRIRKIRMGNKIVFKRRC